MPQLSNCKEPTAAVGASRAMVLCYSNPTKTSLEAGPDATENHATNAAEHGLAGVQSWHGSGTNDGREAIGESEFGMVKFVNLVNLIPS